MMHEAADEIESLRTQLEEANKRLQRYDRRSESGESLGDHFDCLDQLEEQKALVARLVGDITYLWSGLDEHWVTLPENLEILTNLKAALYSLPASIQQDAAILKAARELKEFHCCEVDGKEYVCNCTLCKAVRGEKVE